MEKNKIMQDIKMEKYYDCKDMATVQIIIAHSGMYYRK